MSILLERLPWRDALGVQDPSTVFVSCVRVMERYAPVRVHCGAGILYDGWSPRIYLRRYREGTAGDRIDFVRTRFYSDPVCFQGRLLVRGWIAAELKRRCQIELGNARCICVVDVDLLDTTSVKTVFNDERFDSFTSKDDTFVKFLLERGRAASDDDWFEVIPPTPDDVAGMPGGLVTAEFRALEMEARGAADGLYLSSFKSEPFRLSGLQKHGMLETPVNVMRLDVAELLTPFLPPPFWCISYWRVVE